MNIFFLTLVIFVIVYLSLNWFAKTSSKKISKQMKVPQLKKKLEIKSCHNIDWEDNYSWIHQDNILEVLKDKNKLDPEVKNYLEDENAYTEHHLLDTKDIQKKLFDEIKGRIKLDDES